MFLPWMILPFGVLLARGDLAGFTFLLTMLTMFGAAVFFLFERSQVPPAWRTSLLVAALITLVAGTNYAFMSATWMLFHISPTEFRYLDWFLTVPLICIQFYLLLEASGARPTRGVLWRLVLASWWMLGAGYAGQVLDPGETILWGTLSTVGYAMILFEISLGEAKHLSRAGADAPAKRTFDLLFWFLFVGWAIYPFGYMTMPGNVLAGLQRFLNLDVIYNLGDAVNKVGFGLVVWNLARAETPGRVKSESRSLPPVGIVSPEGPGT